jgi:hypothetical protein
MNWFTKNKAKPMPQPEPQVHEHKWEPLEGLRWTDPVNMKFPHRVYECECSALYYEALDI